MEEISETIVGRYFRYIEEARRDGVIGSARYGQLKGKARKLERFLTIKGLQEIAVRQFDVELLMEYRQFIFDEHLFVTAHPDLYPPHCGHRWPRHRARSNSVVCDLRALKAFFNELESTDEVLKSPFRRLSSAKRKSLMHTMYDDPWFLRADEFHRIVDTPVPPSLQTTKDIFILNCALGCRIGDLKRLSMDKLAVSPEGIPYFHYFPSKTSSLQSTNREIQTPLVRFAFDVVMRTRLRFNNGNARHGVERYNRTLPLLLQHCGIDRKICLYDENLRDNVYVPLWQVATSRLARKTHVDMMNKFQINPYLAGLHSEGSGAVRRYTCLELPDRFALMNVAFSQAPFRVDEKMTIIEEDEKRE